MARERREEKSRKERGYDDLMMSGEGKSNEEGFDEDDFSMYCFLYVSGYSWVEGVVCVLEDRFTIEYRCVAAYTILFACGHQCS